MIQQPVSIGQTLADFDNLSERDSVLKCPETYIDSADRHQLPYWIMSENMQIVKQTCDVPLGLSRLLIEGVANACDNATRCYENGIDPISIDVNVKDDMVNIKNYGLPMPVIWVEDKNMWLPQWVMTTMRTGSNFKGQRHGGGRNGMGTKLIGYFSHYVSIVIYDHINHKMYRQIFRNSLFEISAPEVYDYNGTTSSTELTYQVNLNRFGYSDHRYPNNAYNVFARIVADSSFTCKLPVSFNGMKMNFSSLVDYARLFIPDMKNYVLYYKWNGRVQTITNEDGSERSANNLTVPIIEMIIIETPGKALRVGLCNSILTTEGGIHIKAVEKYISQVIKGVINIKDVKESQEVSDKPKPTRRARGGKKKTNDEENKAEERVTKSTINNNVSIIINVRLPNPSMTGQTKGYLRGYKVDKDSSDVDKFVLSPPPSLKEKILKWDIVTQLSNKFNADIANHINKSRTKANRRVTGSHVEDCEYAKDPKMRDRVATFGAEGDSALGYVRHIRSFIKDGSKFIQLAKFGGKITNAFKKKKNLLQVSKNPFFMQLINLMGLEVGLDYSVDSNFLKLRTRRFIFMTDQDPDGQHIKMLLLSFFYVYFPTLLARRAFFFDWRTQLITTTRPGFQKMKFYYRKHFDDWCKSIGPEELKKWTIKYYKGLGTSTEHDAKEDAENPWIVEFIWDENAKTFLERTMGGNSKVEVKKWIIDYSNSEQNINMIGQTSQYISSFINEEFVSYCLYTLTRHLYSLQDGLNDTQRKILYAAYIKKDWKYFNGNKSLMRLDLFAAYAMTKTHYSHGDLTGVAAGMTQRFVGHDGFQFFVNEGQFGTRTDGGKDCASARYPKLMPNHKMLKALFRDEDRLLLTQLLEDGVDVEYSTFLPIMPMVLINGCRGIASGWSSTIPPFHPLDIIEYFKRRIYGVPKEDIPDLFPFFRGFKGDIRMIDNRDPQYQASTSHIFYGDDLDKKKIKNPHFVDLGMRSSKGHHSIVTSGIMTQEDHILHITELPIGIWTNKYLEDVLDKLEAEDKISDYNNDSTVYDIDITVVIKNLGLTDGNGQSRNPTLDDMGLNHIISLTNMVLIDNNGRPRHYENARDIAEEFLNIRVPFYYKRFEKLIGNKEEELRLASEDYQLLYACSIGKFKVTNPNGQPREEEEMLTDLRSQGLSERSFNKVRVGKTSKQRVIKAYEKCNSIRMELEKLKQINPVSVFIDELDNYKKIYLEVYGDDRPSVSGKPTTAAPRDIVMPKSTRTKYRKRAAPGERKPRGKKVVNSEPQPTYNVLY